MPYVRRNWQNAPSSATPLNAAALNNIEDGVEEAVEAVTGRLSEATLESTIVAGVNAGLTDADIPGQVEAAIADSPTVIAQVEAAAGPAVEAAAAGLDLITAVPLVPAITYDANGHIASINDGAVTETFVNFPDGRIDYSVRDGVTYLRNYVGGEWVSTTVFDPPPEPTVTDSFGRPSTALAGSTTDTGAKVWAASGGTTASIDSLGRVYASAGTGNTWAWLPSMPADGVIEVTLANTSTAPSTMLAGIMFRRVDDNNLLYFQLRQSSTVAGYTLVRRLAGSATTTTTTVIPAAGDRIRLEFFGTNVKAFVNGTQILDTTMTDFATATMHGLFLNRTDSVARFDDFEFYEEAA